MHGNDLTHYDEQAKLWRLVSGPPQSRPAQQQQQQRRQTRPKQTHTQHTNSTASTLRREPRAKPESKPKTPAHFKPRAKRAVGGASPSRTHRGGIGRQQPSERSRSVPLYSQPQKRGGAAAADARQSERSRSVPLYSQPQQARHAQGTGGHGTPAHFRPRKSTKHATATAHAHAHKSTNRRRAQASQGRAGASTAPTPAGVPPTLVVHLKKTKRNERLGFSLKTVDDRIVVSHIWKGEAV